MSSIQGFGSGWGKVRKEQVRRLSGVEVNMYFTCIISLKRNLSRRTQILYTRNPETIWL